MGHSEASLYKYASMGCPFTNGSVGSWNSLGVMSPPLFREEVVNDAKVLARVLNKAEFGDDATGGKVGEEAGSELFEGEIGADWSD